MVSLVKGASIIEELDKRIPFTDAISINHGARKAQEVGLLSKLSRGCDTSLYAMLMLLLF
jgi:hypothetical protein